MNTFILSLFLMGALSIAGNPRPMVDKSTKPAKKEQYGKINKGQAVTSLANVIENFADHKGKMVSFEGVTKKVCKKKGCWMVLEDNGIEVRTLFKDYGFFVPADILGKRVRVQGEMEEKKISKATLKHYAKDAGKKLEEINKIKTGEVQFQFTASGVEVIN